MKKILFCSLIVVSALLCSSAFAQSTFKIMAENLPPFNFEKDGIAQGISVDTLILLMEKVGLPIEQSAIEFVPWARGYDAVQSEAGTVLFSMARTEKREELFQWVGPIFDLTLGLTAKKDRKILLNSLDEAANYTIGTIRDGAPEQLVIDGGISPDALDRISNPELNVKKLAAGRIDMFAFNIPTTRYLMLSIGLDPNEYEVVYTLKRTALYFAFHKDTNLEFIARMNKALEDLKQMDSEGKSEFDAIVERYLGRQEK